MDTYKNIKEHWVSLIQSSTDLTSLEAIRINALGKQGEITQLMKNMGQLSSEERKVQGAALNELKEILLHSLEKQFSELKAQALAHRLIQEQVDVSLPIRPEMKGFFHPLSQALFEIIDIFQSMGFSVVEGPHIEEDYYNFDALNIPPEHPARQDHDTFYMPSDQKGMKKVLRTHTSPVQIRTLLECAPPLRIIVPGRTFRSDYDQTHSPTFHQIEGLMIGKDIHMGHLKYCITEFCRRIFQLSHLPVRFRPSYFPFTEPSAEVDIGYSKREGELILGEGDHWLEILGCGMVHPKVLENCKLDPDQFQGFAFGMGIERVAMLKYGIPDLRAFFETDMRWLRQNGFSIAEGILRRGQE